MHTICPLKLNYTELQTLSSGKFEKENIELSPTSPVLKELLEKDHNPRTQAGWVSNEVINTNRETCRYKIGLEKQLFTLIAKRIPVSQIKEEQAPQSQTLTGTLMFQRDQNKNIKLYQFTTLVQGERGQPYEATAQKKILFVKGPNETLFLWTDPREDSRQATFDMMQKAHVNFTDDLEGRTVEFEATGKKVFLKEDGKEYELVDIKSLQPKAAPRSLPSRPRGGIAPRPIR